MRQSRLILSAVLLFAALLFAALPVAANPFDEFEARARNELIKPFALDLGGILGAASMSSGRALGFPGFEAEIIGATQFRPDKDDRILRDSGVRGFGLPLVSAAVGLPANFDLVVHGMGYQGLAIYGGGVRYGLFKSGLATKFLPSVGVSAFGDRVTYRAFNATHMAFNASAMWDLPVIKPFFGAGFDSTEVKVRAATAAGTVGASATATGTRLAAGAEVVPFPFLRARLAYTLLHGIPGLLFGIGGRF